VREEQVPLSSSIARSVDKSRQVREERRQNAIEIAAVRFSVTREYLRARGGVPELRGTRLARTRVPCRKRGLPRSELEARVGERVLAR